MAATPDYLAYEIGQLKSIEERSCGEIGRETVGTHELPQPVADRLPLSSWCENVDWDYERRSIDYPYLNVNHLRELCEGRHVDACSALASWCLVRLRAAGLVAALPS